MWHYYFPKAECGIQCVSLHLNQRDFVVKLDLQTAFFPCESIKNPLSFNWCCFLLNSIQPHVTQNWCCMDVPTSSHTICCYTPITISHTTASQRKPTGRLSFGHGNDMRPRHHDNLGHLTDGQEQTDKVHRTQSTGWLRELQQHKRSLCTLQ